MLCFSNYKPPGYEEQLARLKQQVAMLQSNLDKFKSQDSGAAKELKKIREMQIQEAKVYVPEAELGEIIKRHGGAKRKSSPKKNASGKKKLRNQKQGFSLGRRKTQKRMMSPHHQPIPKIRNLGQQKQGGKNATTVRHQKIKVMRETLTPIPPKKGKKKTMPICKNKTVTITVILEAL